MSFTAVLDLALAIANIALLVLAAWGMWRNKLIGRYPLPFAFFLFSAVVGLLLLNLHLLPGLMTRAEYARFYWADELIEQGFALSMMVCVMRMALAGEKSSAILGQGLASLAVVLVAVVLTAGNPSFLSSRWMTSFTRNLSFGVALMNFQVWGLLVARRVSNRQVLLLASGLGLLTTGKSLGHTIRIVAPNGGWAVLIGNYTVVLTAILAGYAWWHAFRRASVPSSRPGQENGPTLVKAA